MRTPVYTADSDYLPDWDFQCHTPILNDFTWTDQKGGFEGLRQKGWTAITVSAIKLASLKTNTKISILGQRDNQLLRIKINTTAVSAKDLKDHCVNQIERFRTELDSVFSRIGLPLKMEETWVSEATFSHGKFMIFRGSALPTSLKRASSFRPYSSENIPTLDNSISTISANGMSMSMNDLTADMALISTILETAFCFSYHLKNSLLLGRGLEHAFPNVIKNLEWHDFKKHDFNSYNGRIMLLRLLMICGGILGGYPVSCPLHFIVRGFPDPLTEWLVFLKNLCNVNHSSYLLSFINNIINIDTAKPDSYLGLISEPLSLNILNNSRPEGLMEERWLECSAIQPIMFCRYIEDIFFFWPDTVECPEIFNQEFVNKRIVFIRIYGCSHNIVDDKERKKMEMIICGEIASDSPSLMVNMRDAY
ncbi:hypothetical protein GJ496_003059 [Pomphorhynchus laevis]|nr:hypothetical protein GJ496_003059 [Pomphorhynchus laevis]